MRVDPEIKRGDLIETRQGNIGIILQPRSGHRSFCVVMFLSGKVRKAFPKFRIRRIISEGKSTNRGFDNP